MQKLWWRRWLDEPLVRFVALGALVFALDRALRPEEAQPRRIEITPEFAQAMARREEGRIGRAPSEAELEAAIERFVREEALYREAIEHGLDRGDLIVRRRLVQKMELWLDAQHAGEAPTGAELAAWHAENADELREPARTAIELVFFADGSIDRAVQARADGLDGTSGDPYPHGRTLGPRTDAQIDALLGEGVAEALSRVELGSWSAPIRGRAGVFLLRPTQRLEGRVPSLDEVRERAARELIEARRERERERATEEILARWEIVRSDREDR